MTPPSENAGTDSGGTARAWVRAKTKRSNSTNLLTAYSSRIKTKSLKMVGAREVAIAILTMCNVELEIVRKYAEEQRTHVMVELGVDDTTKFFKNSMTLVAEIPGMEFGLHDNGVRMETSPQKMPN